MNKAQEVIKMCEQEWLCTNCKYHHTTFCAVDHGWVSGKEKKVSLTPIQQQQVADYFHSQNNGFVCPAYEGII